MKQESHSILWKLTTVFVLSVLLPTIFLCLVTLGVMHNSYQNQMYNNLESILLQFINQTNYQLERYKTAMEELAADAEMISLAAQPDARRMYDISYPSLNSISSDGEKMRCTLYSALAEPPFPYSLGMIDSTAWFHNLQENRGYHNWFCEQTGTSRLPLLCLACPVMDNRNWMQDSMIYGVVKLELFADAVFEKRVSDEWITGVDLAVVLPDGELVFSKGERAETLLAIAERMGPLPEQLPIDFGAGTNGFPKNVAFHKIGDQNLYVLCRIDERLLSDNRFNGWIFLGLELCLVAVLIIAVMLFMRRLSARIDLLRQKMWKLQNLDFSITDHVGGNDEITQIDEAFDQMTVQIQQLIAQNYQQQLHLKAAQLDAMLFQIKPHFLYNTLESISSIASMEGSIKASGMIQKLGKMFRYTTYMTSDGKALLREELQYAQAYVDIQNVRFDDKFFMEYHVPPECLDIPVLKFSIQPFIENAVRYAFVGRKKDCRIHIHIYKTGNHDMILEISDNGIGMDMHTLAHVRGLLCVCNENCLTGEHIGIANVHARLRLVYGKGYGITVESIPGTGTKIQMRFHS